VAGHILQRKEELTLMNLPTTLPKIDSFLRSTEFWKERRMAPLGFKVLTAVIMKKPVM
jgi:hypothetical protein